MLEIKTITENTAYFFDKAVNEALTEGWELVRRECFITGADRATTLYAELERIVDEPEEEEDTDIPCDFAQWVMTRNPRNPYRCSACGHTTNAQWATCPKCSASMGEEE